MRAQPGTGLVHVAERGGSAAGAGFAKPVLTKPSHPTGFATTARAGSRAPTGGNCTEPAAHVALAGHAAPGFHVHASSGTKLPLGLLRPLTVKPGRDVYLQVTFPVSVNGQMLIPPGTYVQGMIDKLIRRDRRRDVLQFSIHSANLIFLNGYTVPISGTVTVGTTNARALPHSLPPATAVASLCPRWRPWALRRLTFPHCPSPGSATGRGTL
jgi:hypothetical protein